MKTEKCEEMMNRYLSGERSEELLRHLSECASCRELAALSRLTAEPAGSLKVPEQLDRAILAHAAAKKRTRSLSFTFLMRHALIPVAAAVVVCAGLTFAFRVPSVSRGGKPVMAAVRSQNIASYDFDSADSELLLISSRIQDASAQLNSTAAYSAWDE
ncbi:MAG: hypothetical protein J5806_03395 [Lentisphaeria bacterium]|nr:hypothetical protein [Lentisphaeria bacterium]